jgi:C1A family cysteine protease
MIFMQHNRRSLVPGILSLLFFVLTAFSTICVGAEFDWRTYSGNSTLPAGNYVTAVRDQGKAGTCWAFGVVAAVESRYAINNKIINPTIDLSEQNLVCAGVQNGFGDITGGYASSAIGYVYTTGIVTEAQMPYTALNTSPNWPLTQPYTLYKITNYNYISHTTAASIKTALTSYGPLVIAIYANTDWYWPTDTSSSSTTISTTEMSGLSEDDPTGSINHTVLITGYTDDSSITGAGGGYFHIKNSWGASWGPNGLGSGDGYGYVTYATMLQSDHYVYAITGSVYTVYVPEPSTLAGFFSMTVIGLLIVICRRRK